MGFLDLPGPALSWTDLALAAIVPDAVRLAIWGVVAALSSMGLYWLISPQRRLARVAAEERRVKDRLRDDATELTEGLASAARLLRLSFWRLGLVLGPASIAVLPVLCLMVWLQTQYAYDLPEPGSAVPVRIQPEIAKGEFVAPGDEAPRVDVRDDQGALLQSVPLTAPVPVIHKRAWWNVLIGNPSGYLPPDAPIDRIEIALPEKRYLSVGPDWAGSWEAVFLITLLAGSLLLKVVFRIR